MKARSGGKVLQAGAYVPDLELNTTAGRLRISSYRGRKLVIYFFPKAFTAGCTRELQRFVELYDEFKLSGAEVLGVSVDSVETLRKFGERYGAKFPLASDTSREASRAFGVLKEGGKSAMRVTFIVRPDGYIRSVISNLRRAEEHADRALDEVRAL
ncbi:MAG: peroxiredoxin [Acidilobus sp.]